MTKKHRKIKIAIFIILAIISADIPVHRKEPLPGAYSQYVRYLYPVKPGIEYCDGLCGTVQSCNGCPVGNWRLYSGNIKYKIRLAFLGQSSHRHALRRFGGRICRSAFAKSAGSLPFNCDDWFGRGDQSDFAESAKTYRWRSWAFPRIQMPVFFGIPLNTDEEYYYLILVIVILGYLVARQIVANRVGRSFRAIRDDPLTAQAMGVISEIIKFLRFSSAHCLPVQQVPYMHI